MRVSSASHPLRFCVSELINSRFRFVHEKFTTARKVQRCHAASTFDKVKTSPDRHFG